MFRKKKEVIRSFDSAGREIRNDDLVLLDEKKPEEVPSIIPPLAIECFICADRKFYQDVSGLWHACPRCKGVK